MQINPKVRVFLMVVGFVVLLIGPVSYAIYREYQYRKAANQKTVSPVSATDSANSAK